MVDAEAEVADTLGLWVSKPDRLMVMAGSGGDDERGAHELVATGAGGWMATPGGGKAAGGETAAGGGTTTEWQDKASVSLQGSLIRIQKLTGCLAS